MDIRQCSRCRSLFQYRGNHRCPECVRQVDELFIKVRNYIYEHPVAIMAQIIEATGADEADINTWLREGRLILDKSSTPLIYCEICNKPIVTGRYCDDCAVDMKATLQNGADMISKEKSGASKMHGNAVRLGYSARHGK